MTARRALIWLVLLTLALIALTIVVHYMPLPATTAPVEPSPVVVPIPNEPTLTAAVPVPAAPPALAPRAPVAAG